ncbi:chemotaxis protein CheW [Microbulbifer taiwanensis]|uniref:chemotaxis protein CheW n=1 Tax=Microbulbifer taiwanensis TaxID=986746 RepID=UPI003606B095
MSGVEALPVDVPQEVSSLLLPLADGQLLVPVDTLSEVIAMQTPVAAYDAPPWYLGELNWREQRLPLLSFEVMRGQPLASATDSGRIAVLSSGNPQGICRFSPWSWPALRAWCASRPMSWQAVNNPVGRAS